MTNTSHHTLIGAHTSAAGGAFKALLEGKEIGASTVQLFTANQKRWVGKPISDNDAALFIKTKDETGINTVMSHDSYLINLGSPDKDLLEKSKKAFADEIQRCHKLEIDFLNFHPGAYTSSSREECLEQIIKSLLDFKDLLAKGQTLLLLETTAGQGTTVGSTFEDLGMIVKGVKKHIPIGVCIDTCHIFAAGYDIRTEDGWNKTLQEFDDMIGLDYLKALHVNDSLKALGSKKDRHACLGEGEIGLECFYVIMTHPVLKDLPKYLETPEGKERWKKEIKLLSDYYKGVAAV